MILAVDIGNTNIVIAFFKENNWSRILRINTHESAEKYALDFSNFLLENNFDTSEIQGIVVSSVVPNKTESVVKMLKPLAKTEIKILGPDHYGKLPIQVTNPDEMGTDLVANAIAAYHKVKDNCLVVDFGTALTFTAVDQNGKVLGVSIAPGLKSAMKALSGNTAKLPEVPLVLPKSSMGQDTITAMQSGIMIGYTGLVEKMISSIKSEFDENMQVIATGGLSSILPGVKDQFDFVNTNLTLDGLIIFHELASK